MSGAKVVIQIKRIASDLKKVAKRGHPVVLKAVSDEALSLVQLDFDAGVSPQGKPWEPPKRRPGGQPLRDDGHLMGSVTGPEEMVVTKRGFEIGSNLIYAAVHQYGWPERNIPARPYLPDGDAMPPAWDASLEEAAEEAMARLLK
jgi:phage gpG-like protein